MKARELLLFLSLKFQGNWDSQYRVIRDREFFSKEEMEQTLAGYKGNFFTILDKEYPQVLKRVHCCPFVLHYKGDISLLQDTDKCIAYIGTRDASAYGLRMAERLAGEVSERGFHIVSGMARGIDSAALKAAIRKKGKGIAILGSGIDRPYPESNRELYKELEADGLIISEYPGDLAPKPENFTFRNRLIAGSVKALVVGESYMNSGSMNTVGWAAGSNVDVGAVPYEAGIGSYNNVIIKEGAALIESVDDILAML